MSKRHTHVEKPADVLRHDVYAVLAAVIIAGLMFWCGARTLAVVLVAALAAVAIRAIVWET